MKGNSYSVSQSQGICSELLYDRHYVETITFLVIQWILRVQCSIQRGLNQKSDAGNPQGRGSQGSVQYKVQSALCHLIHSSCQCRQHQLYCIVKNQLQLWVHPKSLKSIINKCSETQAKLLRNMSKHVGYYAPSTMFHHLETALCFRPCMGMLHSANSLSRTGE